MAKVEFSKDFIGGFGVIKGDIHAVATQDGIRLTGRDDNLQHFVGMTQFVMEPDQYGKVYLKNERGVGADVDHWTETNVPNIGVAVITNQK